MPFSIVRNNIASMWTDCIVCPTDSDYSGLGGADHAIHLAAGEQLDEACRSLPPLSVGSVTITRGYNLPVRYILHTMGPVWIDGEQGESESLAACYNAVLTKAAALGMNSHLSKAAGAKAQPQSRSSQRIRQAQLRKAPRSQVSRLIKQPLPCIPGRQRSLLSP